MWQCNESQGNSFVCNGHGNIAVSYLTTTASMTKLQCEISVKGNRSRCPVSIAMSILKGDDLLLRAVLTMSDDKTNESK